MSIFDVFDVFRGHLSRNNVDNRLSISLIVDQVLKERLTDNSMKGELNVIGLLRMMALYSNPSFIDSDPNNNIRPYLESILYWENWTDSSGKADPPPDFFNQSESLMMEVMRISHEQYVDDRGNPHDPSAARVSDFIKEMTEVGGLAIDRFFKCNTVIEAKKETDVVRPYSYQQYLESFNRVVGSHISKINLYRKNHPGFKLIFLIYDESVPYYIDDGATSSNSDVQYYDPVYDEAIHKVLRNADVDMVIWFCPYMILADSPVVPPITFFNPKNPIETEVYNVEDVKCVQNPDDKQQLFFIWWSEDDDGLLHPNVVIGKGNLQNNI